MDMTGRGRKSQEKKGGLNTQKRVWGKKKLQAFQARVDSSERRSDVEGGSSREGWTNNSAIGKRLEKDRCTHLREAKGKGRIQSLDDYKREKRNWSPRKTDT